MNPSIILAVLIAVAPQSAPRDHPAYVLSQDDGGSDGFSAPRQYLSAPQQTSPTTRMAWSWSLSAAPDGAPLIDAFLNEYDCAASTVRRVRQERYRAGVLYDTRVSEAGFRPPHWLEMERRILGEVCRGSYRALPQVESLDAAAARLLSTRP